MTSKDAEPADQEKNKGGRPPIEVDYEKVQRYASRGMDKQEIAACLGMSRFTFWQRLKDDDEFLEAYRKGRALGVDRYAEIVENIALYGEDDNTRLRAALEFLKRHGNEWKDTPQKIELSGGVDVTTSMTKEQLKRGAKTYLALNPD